MQTPQRSIATSGLADTYTTQRGFSLAEPAHGGMTSREALAFANELYGRTLSAWAMDVLALRSKGLDKPRRAKVRAGSGWHGMCEPSATARDARGRA